jgi:hypothetical protein
VSITYANDMVSDGAGGQIQRIIGIVALAEALQANYDHSPIVKIDYHGWNLYLKKEYDAELPRKWDTFLGFPEPQTGCSVTDHVWQAVSPDQLPEISQWILNGCQARIVLPYPFLDLFPQYLDKVRPKLRSWYNRTPKPILEETKKFQVAIHVRRGELHLWESQRMLPNGYYLTIIRELRKYMPADAEFHIHSEGSISTDKGKEEVFRAPAHAGYMREPSKHLKRNRDHFEDFIQEGCILHINEDIFQTFHRCVSADIFVMSKSSLSYVMGAYANGIVVYQPFWHTPLPSWCVMPVWPTIGSLRDLLKKGPQLVREALGGDKSKKWSRLRFACMLQRAQRLIQ